MELEPIDTDEMAMYGFDVNNLDDIAAWEACAPTGDRAEDADIDYTEKVFDLDVRRQGS